MRTLHAPRRSAPRGWRLLALVVPPAITVALFGLLLRGLLTPAPVAAPSATPGPAAPEVDHYAPEVTLRALDGTTRPLSGLRGSVVVLNFWYASCEPCLYEMPALQAAYTRFQSQGVVLVGINVADSAATARTFATRLGITYPLYLDEGRQAASAYRLAQTPTTYVIDRQGVIRQRVVGPVERAWLEGELARLVAAR